LRDYRCRVPVAPPSPFPGAYYQTLAALIPALWIALVFQAGIGKEPLPDEVRRDPVGVAWLLWVRVVGLVGLPLAEVGVLVTLRTQQLRHWIDSEVVWVLVFAAGQVVAPVLWSAVVDLIPTRSRTKVRTTALVVLMVVSFGVLIVCERP